MTKAKPLDRLELTRRKFHMNVNNFDDVPAYPGAEDTQEQELHGDLCPVCGRNTLIHESGCVKCFACNWSKCG